MSHRRYNGLPHRHIADLPRDPQRHTEDLQRTPTPSHRGSANVRVSVTNVNDEDPVFIQPVEHVLVSGHSAILSMSNTSQGHLKVIVEHVLVSEDAPLNTVVHVIQAYDPDGDDVTFAFTGTLPRLF